MILQNLNLVKSKVNKIIEIKQPKIKPKIIVVTKTFTLEKIKPLLNKGSILLFDQFYGFPNWQDHEFKAFKEVFKEGEYRYIAFCESEVAIEML